jgi:hypothetical protein
MGGPAQLPICWMDTAFFDVDNDTWLDILVANGQVYPQGGDAGHGNGMRMKLLFAEENQPMENNSGGEGGIRTPVRVFSP